MVGHIADLRVKDVSVSADDAGTEMMYGAGKVRSWSAVCFGSAIGGNDGVSTTPSLVHEALQTRKVIKSFCFRMRLR